MADLSPFQWGKPALENYQSKKKVGWLLWKQPSMSEVLAVLKREQLFSSVANFPLHRQLQVSVACMNQMYTVREPWGEKKRS